MVALVIATEIAGIPKCPESQANTADVSLGDYPTPL